MSYYNADPLIYKDHRIKTERDPMTLKVKVQWQRDFRKEHRTDEGNPTSPSWDSTTKTFDTPNEAVAFAKLVLEGEINSDGVSLIEALKADVAEGNARRTQHWGN